MSQVDGAVGAVLRSADHAGQGGAAPLKKLRRLSRAVAGFPNLPQYSPDLWQRLVPLPYGAGRDAHDELSRSHRLVPLVERPCLPLAHH